MANTTPAAGIVEEALAFARLGFGVFPLRPGGKTPLYPNPHPKGSKERAQCKGECGQVGHGALDGTHNPAKIRAWFEANPRAGIGGNTRNYVVFDVDLQHGGRLLDAFPETRTHYSGRGNGNRHLIYAYEPNSLAARITSATGWVDGIDTRAGVGSYVVLPPSTHPETGQPYTVGPENGGEFHRLTDEEVRAIASEAGVALPGLGEGRKRSSSGAVARSSERPTGEPEGGASRDSATPGGLFAQSAAVQLILNPPTRGEGKTNDALATVAGYYARLYREDHALYEHHVRQWVARVDPDYEDTTKTMESVWDTEQSKEGERARRVEERVEAKLIEHEAKAQFAQALAALDPAEPFDAGSLAEILARPDTARFRVEGLMLSEGFTTVVAARKTGKTTFNLNLAEALLTGRDFLGRFPVEPVKGRIALLNYEVAAKQVAHWASLVGIDPERFDVVTLRGRRNPLLHPQDRAELAEYLRGRGVEFLFVDPLSRAFYGDNANDNTQMQRFLSDLDTFARSEVGATDVVLNVHAGWNQDRSRGASATEDHPDSIIWLRPGDREKGDRSTYFAAKGRDVDVDEMQLAFDPSTYRLSLTGGGSRREAKQEQKTEGLRDPILATVRAHPGVNTSGIEARLRTEGVVFQKGDVSRALAGMAVAGLIRREQGPRNSTLNYPAGDELTMPRGGAADEY